MTKLNKNIVEFDQSSTTAIKDYVRDASNNNISLKHALQILRKYLIAPFWEHYTRKKQTNIQ